MTFLQPLLLLALPLLAIPIVIHMLNRLRYRSREWAAMRFLLRATRSSTRYARVRQFLVLACRALAIAALIFALSRPLTGGWLGATLAGPPDTVYLLLDSSPSMGARTAATADEDLRRRAIHRIADAAARMQSTRFLLVDPATLDMRLVPTPDAVGAAASARTTDGSLSIPAMLHASAAHLASEPAGRAEIWIASDLADSDWRPTHPLWPRLVSAIEALPEKVTLRVLALRNESATVNRSIAVTARRTEMHEGRRAIRLHLEVTRTDESEESIPLEVATGGQRSRVTIPLAGPVTRFTQLVNVGDASGWGSIQLPEDANARDNTAYFCYGDDVLPGAAVVSRDRFVADVLSSALNPLPGHGGAVLTKHSPENASAIPFGEIGTLVWQGPAPTDRTAELITSFLRSGGTALFLPAGRESDAVGSLPGWEAPQRYAENGEARADVWAEAEGPLAASTTGESLPVDHVEVRRFQRARLSESRVLARLEDGAALLQASAVGNGHLYSLGTVPHPEWSTLADGTVLVPMLQRLLAEGSVRLSQARMLPCANGAPHLSASDWIPVTVPSGRFGVDAGIYTNRATAAVAALNIDPAEVASARITPDQARDLLGGLPMQLWEEDSSTSDQDLQGELWRGFLWLMLLFLAGEALFSLPPPLRQEAPA